MIRNTFCHFPGIGAKTEQQLWENGLQSWEAINEASVQSQSKRRRETLLRYARESSEQLDGGNARYFCDLLPSSQSWRLFPEFQHRVAYLDIETTGLSSDTDYVTTIALYDGEAIYTFVRGENLEAFAERIAQYDLIVTYNGKSFDVPFLRQHLGIPLPHAHIDLRYVLASLGQSGGLKACEKRFGLDRKELADVDGYFAVLLWHDYVRSGDRKVLDTLLAYNIADVVNLAVLMPLAYNMKVEETPFRATHLLPPATVPEIPFKADPATIQRLQRRAW